MSASAARQANIVYLRRTPPQFFTFIRGVIRLNHYGVAIWSHPFKKPNENEPDQKHNESDYVICILHNDKEPEQ